ncbi:MAG: hypothetical protein IT445_11575 [Phycisphaeraceae bacterium]|nr:hypothetical protein [Phycisphaeraceae bacterium]
MDPLQVQIRLIEATRAQQACRQSPGEKIAAGLRLYGQIKRRMIAGIRMRHPDADEAEIRRHLRQWLRTSRHNENLPWTN